MIPVSDDAQHWAQTLGGDARAAPLLTWWSLKRLYNKHVIYHSPVIQQY